MSGNETTHSVSMECIKHNYISGFLLVLLLSESKQSSMCFQQHYCLPLGIQAEQKYGIK